MESSTIRDLALPLGFLGYRGDNRRKEVYQLIESQIRSFVTNDLETELTPIQPFGRQTNSTNDSQYSFFFVLAFKAGTGILGNSGDTIPTNHVAKVFYNKSIEILFLLVCSSEDIARKLERSSKIRFVIYTCREIDQQDTSQLFIYLSQIPIRFSSLLASARNSNFEGFAVETIKAFLEKTISLTNTRLSVPAFRIILPHPLKGCSSLKSILTPMLSPTTLESIISYIPVSFTESSLKNPTFFSALKGKSSGRTQVKDYYRYLSDHHLISSPHQDYKSFFCAIQSMTSKLCSLANEIQILSQLEFEPWRVNSWSHKPYNDLREWIQELSAVIIKNPFKKSTVPFSERIPPTFKSGKSYYYMILPTEPESKFAQYLYGYMMVTLDWIMVGRVQKVIKFGLSGSHYYSDIDPAQGLRGSWSSESFTYSGQGLDLQVSCTVQVRSSGDSHDYDSMDTFKIYPNNLGRAGSFSSQYSQDIFFQAKRGLFIDSIMSPEHPSSQDELKKFWTDKVIRPSHQSHRLTILPAFLNPPCFSECDYWERIVFTLFLSFLYLGYLYQFSMDSNSVTEPSKWFVYLPLLCIFANFIIFFSNSSSKFDNLANYFFAGIPILLIVFSDLKGLSLILSLYFITALFCLKNTPMILLAFPQWGIQAPLERHRSIINMICYNSVSIDFRYLEEFNFKNALLLLFFVFADFFILRRLISIYSQLLHRTSRMKSGSAPVRNFITFLIILLITAFSEAYRHARSGLTYPPSLIFYYLSTLFFWSLAPVSQSFQRLVYFLIFLVWIVFNFFSEPLLGPASFSRFPHLLLPPRITGSLCFCLFILVKEKQVIDYYCQNSSLLPSVLISLIDYLRQFQKFDSFYSKSCSLFLGFYHYLPWIAILGVFCLLAALHFLSLDFTELHTLYFNIFEHVVLQSDPYSKIPH